VKRLRPPRSTMRSPSRVSVTWLFSGRFARCPELATRDRDIARLLHGDFRGRHQFDFQIGTRGAQPVVTRAQQYVRQYRHGLPPFDHTITLCKRFEQMFAGCGDFMVAAGPLS